MSVSGEFQRYLASTLESVEEAERTLEGEEAASISALRTGLESARMGEETPLADRATLVLDALEHHLFGPGQGETYAPLAGRLPEVLTSAEDLDRIGRIILGRPARSADKGTSPA